MASIRQRGIYWEARVRRDGWPTISRSFNTKADARAWATVIESEMERGVFIDRTEAEKNTLGDLFQRYLTEVSSQKKGHDTERYPEPPEGEDLNQALLIEPDEYLIPFGVFNRHSE